MAVAPARVGKKRWDAYPVAAARVGVDDPGNCAKIRQDQKIAVFGVGIGLL